MLLIMQVYIAKVARAIGRVVRGGGLCLDHGCGGVGPKTAVSRGPPVERGGRMGVDRVATVSTRGTPGRRCIARRDADVRPCKGRGSSA